MYVEFAMLKALGVPHRQVRALRAPQFPYFKGTVETLGSKVDGRLHAQMVVRINWVSEPRDSEAQRSGGLDSL